MAVALRDYAGGDLDALYDICLRTALSGADASALHHDPQLVGHIYSAPYAVLEPALTLVAADEQGVAGYIVGTFDTKAFAARQEAEWWPALRQRYTDIDAPQFLDADRQRLRAIHYPETNPPEIVARYPAHVHMNLLPRLRGRGVGTMLLERWIIQARAANVPGIHLGANAGNTGGVAFWQRSGFKPLLTQGRTIWLGMTLD